MSQMTVSLWYPSSSKSGYEVGEGYDGKYASECVLGENSQLIPQVSKVFRLISELPYVHNKPPQS